MDSTELEKNGEIDGGIRDNGKYDGENIDGKSLDENLSPSPSPPPSSAATKGRGLRKWRRIRREAGKETNSSLDSNRKRGSTAFPIGMKQKSEGSSSSTNAVSIALDRNNNNNNNNNPVLLDLGSDFATRADSENSEDRNSRSSTAASVPRSKNLETVRNLGVSIQSGDQMGKGRNVRGRIKKENSLSSVESDSRSSNFVFAKGSSSNGKQSCRSGNNDEEYSDDALNGGDQCLNEESRNGNEGDSEEISREDLGAENSWEVKEGKVDDRVESGDRDEVAESVMPLHLAQEALEREVQKLMDVGKEDPLSNDTKISELESIINYENIKIEHDEILKQRIAAEIEFLVISTTIQNLKTSYKNQTNLLTVQQKNIPIPVSVPVPVSVPKAVKVEDEGETARKLRKRVWRYGFWFIIQLVLFVVVVYLLVFKFSSQNMEVLPT